jgi:hypothetical protein
MAASTVLPDGTRLRWHADLTECDQSECPKRHLSKAELFADLDAEAAT